MATVRRPLSRARTLGAVLWLILLLAGILGRVAHAQDGGDYVLLVEITGPINHVTASFVARALEQAEADGAELVLFRVNTPGGLLDATRDIVGDLLDSPVPTVAFVAPSGAHAASAGTFIVAAAHLAVMTTGTNIGAASPVGSGGEDLPETLASKATNDAAALIREIAEARGRNVEALEDTVLLASAYGANQALELEVVDLLAADVDDLLRLIDGRTVTLEGEERTLHTVGLTIRFQEKTLLERFLTILADPNLSFLLLSLGSLGLVVEFWNPGLFVPGVAGAIFLVLAYLGLGNLPANWAGVVFIVLAAILAVLEVYISGFGALGVGAVISFALGAFLLFAQIGGPSPTAPGVSISPWLLFPSVLAVAGGGGWVLWTVVSSGRRRPEEERHPLLGTIGHTVTDLDPRGSVQLRGELWTATTQGGEPIKADKLVLVVAVEGAVLTVVPREEEDRSRL